MWCALFALIIGLLMFARFSNSVGGRCCWCALGVILVVVVVCAFCFHLWWSLMFARFMYNIRGRCFLFALGVIMVVIVVCVFPLQF